MNMSQVLTKPCYCFICPIGGNDPWSKPKEQTEWLPRTNDVPYGAALSIIEKYQYEIGQVIFLVTEDMQLQLPLIEDEMQRAFPDIPYEIENLPISNPTDFEMIEKYFRPVLDKYKQLDQYKFLINSTSSTPQIINYLSTLMHINYFGKPLEDAFLAYAHDPRKYRGAEEDRITLKQNRLAPIKHYFDSYQIATLINEYDYTAALQLIRQDQKLKLMEPSVELLKDLLNLNFNAPSVKSAIDPSNSSLDPLVKSIRLNILDSLFKTFLLEAFSYWATWVKFKRGEWQDFILRTAALREYFLEDTLFCHKKLKSYCKKQNGSFSIFDWTQVLDEEKELYIQEGRELFGQDKEGNFKFREPTEGLNDLTVDSMLIFLKIMNHPIAKPAGEMRYIVGLRNFMAHGLGKIDSKKIRRLQSTMDLLTCLVEAARPVSHSCCLWRQNFFDSANQLLLSESKLEWMIKQS